ncbi:MAG: Cro/CI family transcriptional regulator [Betaproteobacteria bacterium]|nr:Cro/CI family transcriptional regulator [Betaproteobacteria bacterium]
MNYDDLIGYFGSQIEVARAFGVTSASVSEWQSKGVPPLRQVQGEGLTGKKLKADPDVYEKPTNRARAA